MLVDLISVPYDSGRYGERLGAGPEHLLRGGLVTKLEGRGYDVRLRRLEPPSVSWRAEIRTTFDLAREVAIAVAEVQAQAGFPLVLSGNCGPAAMGCVAGLGSSPAVIWFDAHGDFNTPETTVGGFLDGMALATVTGRCWPQLAASIPGFEPTPEGGVALLGARDLDPLEGVALESSAIHLVKVAELRARLTDVLEEVGTAHAGCYVHLDLDVLDPSEGRMNPFAAPQGLSGSDVEWALTAIARAMPIRAAALTAFDPASDTGTRALDRAVTLGLALVDAAHREG